MTKAKTMKRKRRKTKNKNKTKYSKRKYMNKARTTRRYSRKKYTKHNYKKHKTKRKLRGGMDQRDYDADDALFQSVVGGPPTELSEGVPPEGGSMAADKVTDLMTRTGIKERLKAEKLLEGHADNIDQAQEAHLRSVKGEGLVEDLVDLVDLEDLGDDSGSAEGGYSGWYIRTGADEPEKKGFKTTDELEELSNGTVINYTESLEGSHQTRLTNLFLRTVRSAPGFGIYKNGKINPAGKEDGIYVPMDGGESLNYNDNFKEKYHIKVINEGITIKTDFVNQKYIIITGIDPGNPLALDFNSLIGKNLTIQKYKGDGTSDNYCIIMNQGEIKYKSDMTWSQFDALVKSCLANTGPSGGDYKDYTKVPGCQKSIQEIEQAVTAFKEDTSYLAAHVGKAASRAASQVYSSLPDMVGMPTMGMPTMGGFFGAAEPEPAAVSPTEAEAEPEPAGQAAEDDFDGETVTDEINAGDLPPLDWKINHSKRKFMIASIGRLIKCGFLKEIIKQQLHTSSKEVVDAPGSKDLVLQGGNIGFMGAAIQLAAKPVATVGAVGSDVVNWTYMTVTQRVQNIMQSMLPEEWLTMQGEIRKELLYEQMCNLGEDMDDKVASTIRMMATATKTVGEAMGKEKVSKAADKMDSGAKTYQGAKQGLSAAATAASWWASLTPTGAAATAAWKSANLTYYVYKIKSNDNKATKPAQDLWDNLCMLLVDCEPTGGWSTSGLNNQRTLNVLSKIVEREINVEEVLQYAYTTGHPLLQELKNRFGAGPRPGSGAAMPTLAVEDTEPEPEPDVDSD